MRHGAIGLTAAKAGEAAAMATASRDLLIAYPASDPYRLKRLVEAARDNDVKVAVDSVFAIDKLSDAATSSGVIL